MARTAWQEAGSWYHRTVGEKGHYYHQAVIIPNVLRLLALPSDGTAAVLDLACGQGVLSRHLPDGVSYVGIDAAPVLLSAAQHYRPPASHHFIQADITQPLPIERGTFSHATILLALQNVAHPDAVLKHLRVALRPNASCILVLNHPCFRIPRQSSWQIDEAQKTQYRRIDRYMSPLKIPIQTHPGRSSQSSVTWSFHHPLSSYIRWLAEAGFAITALEEWCSDKTSEGRAAKMENRSRQEIPLFLALVARLLQ